jgi:hypothetical protein
MIITIQLLFTECLSVVAFGVNRFGFGAPFSLLVGTVFALLDRRYKDVFPYLPIDVVFILILVLLIITDRKLLASCFLVVFNLVCVILTLGSL